MRVFSRNPNWVFQSVFDEKEGILVPMVSGKSDLSAVYCLNETGVFIWKALDTPLNAAELERRMLEAYEGVTDFRQDLDEFVGPLVECGALQAEALK